MTQFRETARIGRVAKTNFRYLPTQNIVHSDADIIVNTVNCVGVMGAGVAKAFLAEFGRDRLAPYFRACAAGALHPGDCPLFPLGDRRLWAAFASKNHWRHPSRLEWIEHGLANLAVNAREADARSIALPPPGCGLGGLDWSVVHAIAVGTLNIFDRVDFFALRP